jgi:hypothetical protein
MTDLSEEEAQSLDSQVFFQNSTTGQASQHPLSIRQLCRIVGSEMTTTQLLTPETQVLRVTSSGSFVSTWEPARLLYIVRQVVALWHYEVANDSSASEVRGPISCRKLAELLRKGELMSHTRVYSQWTDGKWKPIADLPELTFAMDAFIEQAVSNAAVTTTEPSMTTEGDNIIAQHIKNELNTFLSSTEHLGNGSNAVESDDDAASFESDEGTRYVKDSRTGKWIHEALAMRHQLPKISAVSGTDAGSKKRKRAKFAAKNSRCWVYVTGLPVDTTEDEIALVFSKAGIIALDPETQRPKVKLYRDKESGHLKGDASIGYARPESVELATTLLDGSPFGSASALVKVTRAKFEQRGGEFDANRTRISNEKRKVAKLAAIQARDWDDGEINGRLTGGRKGLRIIVLKGLFDSTRNAYDDAFFDALELDLRTECSKCGIVEKITMFSKNPQGVAVVKFAQPGAASDAVKSWDGRVWKECHVRSSFWDGVTDFTARNDDQEEKDAEERHEEFGNWLDNQELPEELRLLTE